MRVLDFYHQQRVIAPTTYIETFRIPCEGTLSRIEGQIIMIAKDYTNQPTFSAINVEFLNSVYHMMPNAEVNFAATLGGVAVAPVPSLKDTDIGTPIRGIITTGGELVTITITCTVVPDPFMLYIRPQIIVTALTDIKDPAARDRRDKIELPYTPSDASIPFVDDRAYPSVGPTYERAIGKPVQGQVSGIDVIKYNRSKH